MAQHRQISRPKSKHQRKPKCEVREAADREGHSPPRSARGGHHGPWWGSHGRSLATHGRAPLVHPIFSLFCATFRLPAVFALFCPYNDDVPGHSNTPNSYLIHPIPFSILSILDQSSLERERGSGEELQGLSIGLCDRKTEARVWMSKLFPFSSLFSIQFIFCNFDLSICSFNLEFMHV